MSGLPPRRWLKPVSQPAEPPPPGPKPRPFPPLSTTGLGQPSLPMPFSRFLLSTDSPPY